MDSVFYVEWDNVPYALARLTCDRKRAHNVSLFESVQNNGARATAHAAAYDDMRAPL